MVRHTYVRFLTHQKSSFEVGLSLFMYVSDGKSYTPIKKIDKFTLKIILVRPCQIMVRLLSIYAFGMQMYSSHLLLHNGKPLILYSMKSA